MMINYKTELKKYYFSETSLTIEAIEDLDQAIDDICVEIERRGESGLKDHLKDPLSEDLCPYFGVPWPAGVALTHYLDNNKNLFKNKNTLEIGAGLALPSLFIAKNLEEVTITDFHQDVYSFLEKNMAHNNISSQYVKYHRFNWRQEGAPFGSDQFDFVIGSDILYESKHPKEIAKTLDSYCAPSGTILLTDPGRTYLQNFVTSMKELGHQEELISTSGPEGDIYLLKFLKKARTIQNPNRK